MIPVKSHEIRDINVYCTHCSRIHQIHIIPEKYTEIGECYTDCRYPYCDGVIPNVNHE